jgi:hypothetical protein
MVHTSRMKNTAHITENCLPLIDQDHSYKFAQDWIEAWNSHDIKRILTYCSQDFALTTPYITTVMKEPSGCLKGKGRVSRYLERTFQRIPDLRFELLDVFPGVRSIVVLYRSLFGKHTAEWMLFGDDGKVIRSISHHV